MACLFAPLGQAIISRTYDTILLPPTSYYGTILFASLMVFGVISSFQVKLVRISLFRTRECLYMPYEWSFHFQGLLQLICSCALVLRIICDCGSQILAILYYYYAGIRDKLDDSPENNL